MKKRILSLLLVLSMLVGIVATMPLTVGAATLTQKDGWYLINSISDWKTFASSSPNGNYKLETDLDFSTEGYTQVVGFTGTFDGNGHTISGITMEGDGEIGMFNCGGGTKTLRNFVLKSSTFNGKSGEWVGALICDTLADTVIENVYLASDVKVTGKKYVGGFVGGCGSGSHSLTITDSVFAGTVSLTDQYGGGFVGSGNSSSGKLHSVEISNCLMIGVVSTTKTSSPRTSGFLGYNYQKNTTDLVNSLTNCINAGTGTNNYSRFADAGYLTVTDCYSTTNGNMWCDDYNGGDSTDNVTVVTLEDLKGLDAIDITGFTKRAEDIMVPNGVASFAPPLYASVYEIVWKNYDGTVLDTEEYVGGSMPEYKGAEPTKPSTELYSYEFSGWTPSLAPVSGAVVYTATFDEVLIVEEWDVVGGAYVINNVKQWFYFIETVNGGDKLSGKTVKLGADLDFDGVDFLTPMKGFRGTFDGNYKTISNLHMSGSGDVALFCDVGDGAAFKNLVFKSSSFTVDINWVAPLACCGTGNYTVNNIYVGKDVVITAGQDRGNSYAGGIIAGVNGSDNVVLVDGCVFAGTVNADGGYSAGIVGGIYDDHPEVVISNCLNIGTINGAGSYTAGIATGESGNVENCVNAGTVTGNSYVAGIFAGNITGENKTSITGCYTVGTLFAFNSKNGGTYTEENNTGDVRVNAFVGTNASVTIEGWTKRDGDIMVPAGVASVAEAWYVAPELRGEGTAQAPYLIGSAEEWEIFLALAAEMNNYSGMYVKLDADIDFDGGNVEKLVGFAGTFDGNYFAIKNLNMSGSADVGLFCSLADGAVLKNLVIKSSTITANKNWVGALACCAGGDVTIQNIYVDKDVTVTAKENKDDTAFAGGILGGVYGSGNTVVVENCVFAGTVIAKGDYASGIVGNVYDENSVTVRNCMNAGYVESTMNYVAGIATAMGITIQDCVNVGVVKGNKYVGGIYAGNPKTTPVVISDCYSVGKAVDYNYDAEETITITNVISVSYGKLVGNNATVPAGFAKRAGDFAVPATLNNYIPMLLTQQLYNGASVRLSNPTGIRFTAILGSDYLNALKKELTAETATFGIIIAPTDYINQVDAFTLADLEALKAELGKETYVIIPADKLLNGGEADGYYEFTGVLANIKNNEMSFSAIAYVEINGEYYYSAFDVDNNSRSIAYVAQKAYEDTSYEQTSYYDDEIADQAGVYSPYTKTQRDLLLTFFQKEATDIHFLTYNIRNVEDTSGWLDRPTFEYTNREKYVIDYLKSCGADVIGLQEAAKLTATMGTLDWFDTLKQLESAGYTCVKGANVYAEINEKEMYNPIYFKTEKYNLIDSGSKWFTSTPDVPSTINGANTHKNLNFVVLEDKATGKQFIYVNLHLIVAGDNNFVHDGDGNDTEFKVQELQVIYLRAILEELQAKYPELPMFIGGDFNNSHGSVMDWFKKSVINGEEWEIAEGDPTEEITISIARDQAVSTAPYCSSCPKGGNFSTAPDYSRGPIDLWFISNMGEGFVHCYHIMDNKFAEPNQAGDNDRYPSDHLPVKFYVTLYSEKTN